MAGKKHNYLMHYEHPVSERAPNGLVGNQSYASADKACGDARRIASWGAVVVTVTRKSDGKLICDPINGIELDYKEW